MADAAIEITAGTGTQVDTRTEGTNGNHRQVVVVGDPDTNAGVAPVDGTAGLKVDLGADNDVVATNGGTFAVQEDGAALTALQLIDDVVHVDDAAFTLGTSKGVMMMGYAGTQSVNSGDAAALACSTAGVLSVSLSGAGLTALQLIDDCIYVDDADWTDGTSKHALVGGLYQSTLQTITDGDVGPIQVDANGRQRVVVESIPADPAKNGPSGITSVDSYGEAVVDLAAGTDNQELVAIPGANKQIWVYGLMMKTNGTTATVTLVDEDDTAHSGTITLTDSDGFVVNPSGNFEMPWIKVATNKALDAVTTGSGTVDGIITYAIVDVS